MNISMYHASVPVCVRMLNNLGAILEKAQAWAEARDIDPAVLVSGRLAPDMFPLVRQVQIATDVARRCAERLAGREPDFVEDTETTLPELVERIRRAVATLESFTPEQLDGSEERAVTLKLRGEEVTFRGLPYLLYFVLPNVFFHVTTAYAILRHNGLDIGKTDYLGDLRA